MGCSKIYFYFLYRLFSLAPLLFCAPSSCKGLIKSAPQDLILTLEIPETPTAAFITWVIDARHSELPVKTIPIPKDKRTLSFGIDGARLV